MRRLPRVRPLLLCAEVAAVLWWQHVHPGDRTAADGAFIGALISVIVEAFGWIADKAVTIAVTIAEASVMIWSAIASFAVLVGHVFLNIWGFLGKFWDTTLRPFISWTWGQIQRFEGWLKRTFDPVIRFLTDVRREFQRIYDHWFRPIFDTIEITRRILRVLATLHVSFARELDKKLGELEARLLAPITFVMRRLNEAMNVINRIVTLDGLVQRITFIATLVRDAELSWGVLLHPQLRDVDPDHTAALRAQAYPRLTSHDLSEQLSTFYNTGGGPIGVRVQSLKQQAGLPGS